MQNNSSKSLLCNFSNLSSTLDCSLTLSFRALCTRCRPSKFHVLISFHEREKGAKNQHVFLASLLMENSVTEFSAGLSLSFFDGLARFLHPTQHSGSKRQKPAKNLIQKNREIDFSYLCLQQFDEFLVNMKCIQ